MNLDTLAKAATESLHEQTGGDTNIEDTLVALKRTQSRRSVVKVIAGVAAVLLVGWLAVGPGFGHHAQPAGQYHHTPGALASNGVLLGARDGVPTVLAGQSPDSAKIDLWSVPDMTSHPALYSWSPDGMALAYATPTTVGILDIDTGDSHPLVSCAYCQLAWSPTGDVIAVVDPPVLRIVSAETGATLRTIVTPGLSGPSWPTWSPDGTQLAFTAHDDNRGFGSQTGIGIYRVDADGRHLTPVWTPRPGTDERAWMAAWSPDGSVIAFVKQSPTAFVFKDGGGMNLQHLSIMTITPDGSNPTELAKLRGCLCAGGPSLAWSPDGSRIAFYAINGASNALYVLDRNGRGLHQVTTGVSGPIAWQPVL